MALVPVVKHKSWRKRTVHRQYLEMETVPSALVPVPNRISVLPQAESNPVTFVAATGIELLLLLLVIVIGATVKHAVTPRTIEQTMLILPQKAPKPTKAKLPKPPKVEPPKPEEIKPLNVKLEAPRIHLPKPEPKPDLKPIQIEAKLNTPMLKAAKPNIIEAPQPKAALQAAMPAQDSRVKPSTAPVHLGSTSGVTPNANASRPATIAAIGNPYGGMNGPSVAPHGVVGSTGIGNGLKSGSNSGVVGKVASAGVPGTTAPAPSVSSGKVASAGIPTMAVAKPAQLAPAAATAVTNLEVLSKPAPQYTSEAKQLRVQGNVILRVTFAASGQVLVQSLVHGLGHGLDEEARRVAQSIRFRPATRNGQAVDLTTNITITFQLA